MSPEMDGVRACLVDVYQTLVAYDFEAHSRHLAALAGADPGDWQRSQIAATRDFDAGLLSVDAAMTRNLTDCHIEPSPDLVGRLARAQTSLMADCGRYPDAIPFLREARDRGLKIALVSNCGADTRPLLGRLNLIELADEVILSCEVGCPKPEPEIYHRALDALGVPAGQAVMIDDQPSYCAGAEAAGVRAIQVARDGTAPDPRFRSVPSLMDIPPLL
ncbi:MAG: HAD-IA family hydrolase [Nocardiopsaceae bacterium]|nr:HAD-IA family hydrolase [Nocardiopsaceae bacterium]